MTTYTICISSVVVHGINNLNHLQMSSLCESSFGPAENLGQRGLLGQWHLWQMPPHHRLGQTRRSSFQKGSSQRFSLLDDEFTRELSDCRCSRAPPAVNAIVPEESIVPARSPAVPAALLVMMPKF